MASLDTSCVSGCQTFGSRPAFSLGLIASLLILCWESYLIPHVLKVVSTPGGGNFISRPTLISGNCSANCFPALFLDSRSLRSHMCKSVLRQKTKGTPCRFLQLSLWEAPSSLVHFPAKFSYSGLPECKFSNSLQFSNTAFGPFPDMQPGNCHQVRLGSSGRTSLTTPSARDHTLLLVIGLNTIISHTFYSF